MKRDKTSREILYQSSYTGLVILVIIWKPRRYHVEISTEPDSNPIKKSQLVYEFELEL